MAEDLAAGQLLVNSINLLSQNHNQFQKEYGLLVKPDIFKSPNARAMNAVFHFLYCLIADNAKQV